MSENNGVVLNSSPNFAFIIEGWTIQPTLNTVARGTHITHLEPKAMQLLVFMAAHPGEVLSRDAILDSVWSGTFVSDQVLTNAIWQIRHAFGERGKELVQTIPKTGYRLNANMDLALPTAQIVYDREVPGPRDTLPQVEAPPSRRKLWRGFSRNRKKLAILATIVVALLFIGYLLMRPPVVLAVLPFQNVSGDERQEFPADVFTENLIQLLGTPQSRKFGVIAWSAVLPYRRSAKPLQEIGKELKVKYILEGRMWQRGSLTHVSVELVDVASQRQVWSANYEHPAEDLATLQAGIAGEITAAIQQKSRKPR